MKTKRILVIGADPALPHILRSMLTGQGYEVINYNNDDILSSKQYIIPDVFILEEDIPGRSGVDLCRALKRQQSTMYVPVVIVAKADSTISVAKSAGADAILSTFFEAKILRDTIAQLFAVD